VLTIEDDAGADKTILEAPRLPKENKYITPRLEGLQQQCPLFTSTPAYDEPTTPIAKSKTAPTPQQFYYIVPLTPINRRRNKAATAGVITDLTSPNAEAPLVWDYPDQEVGKDQDAGGSPRQQTAPQKPPRQIAIVKRPSASSGLSALQRVRKPRNLSTAIADDAEDGAAKTSSGRNLASIGRAKSMRHSQTADQKRQLRQESTSSQPLRRTNSWPLIDRMDEQDFLETCSRQRERIKSDYVQKLQR